MKIALLGINSNLIRTRTQERIIDFLKNKLYEIGENTSLISYFENNFTQLQTIYERDYNLIFCIGTNQSIYNHNIKENLSRILGDKLHQEKSCHSAIEKYCADHNIPFSSAEKLESEMPTRSIALYNSNCSNYGFMYKTNDKYLIYLPDDYDFVVSNFNQYILPLLHDLSQDNLECSIIRCYGILEKDIRNLLNDEMNNGKISIQIQSLRLDNIIYIRHSNQHNEIIQELLSTICSKLNKFIYAMENTDLYETAHYLLNLHKKQLVVAETLTLGNITKNICLKDNNLICDSFVFNNFNSITKHLNLDNKIIETYGKYSVNTVYELDNLLLEKSNANIAIFILGESGFDTCYIAIGDLDGIHVYKNKIYTCDENLIDNISETALFYLIKKLRKNDLQFS